MRTISLFLAISSFATRCFGSETNLTLEIEARAQTVRVGNTITVDLRLINSGVALTGIEELDDGMLSLPDFHTAISIRPSQEGELLIGPYELPYMGQKLISNQLCINVLPRWDGLCGIFYRIDKKTISLGESVEVVMEEWSKEPGLKKYRFKINDPSFNYRYTAMGSGPIRDRMKRDEPVYESLCAWQITPLSRGKFHITKDLFESFPEDAPLLDFTITVK